MKKALSIGFVCAALLGAALHFLYTWCPQPLVGLFAPVNESVWEHLKLLYWPFLVVCVPLQFRAESPAAFWGASAGALLIMPAALLGVYYPARYGFGIVSLAFDIILYLLILALGFYLLSRLQRNARIERLAGVLIMLAGLYGSALFICSAAPLSLPIFQG